MKHLLASLLICFCLTTQLASAKHYNNDWRTTPFVEMMLTMMRAMNQVLGSNNSLAGFNNLPYSPAFVPGIANNINYLNGFNRLPMSPNNMHPLYSNPASPPVLESFNTGENRPQRNAAYLDDNNDFWDPDAPPKTYTAPVMGNNSLNGIWQAFSGDVIAIYNNNRFLWSDGRARNLAGHLAIKGNNMIAYIPAKNITLYFQLYMEPGQFIVRDQSARVYTFKRIH